MTNNIVKIQCDNNESGSGFLINANTVITAYHVVMDSTNIDVHINTQKLNAMIDVYDESADIALLSLSSSLDVEPIELEATVLRINNNWQTYGFPAVNQFDLTRFTGKVYQWREGKRYDYILSCEEIDSNYSYDGLSGAPVYYNDKICGVILQQLEQNLGIISIKKIEQFLLSNNIEISYPYDNIALPDSLKQIAIRSIPNYDVFDKLDSILDTKNNWVLMTGNPGSGKTILSATYEPSDESYVILGRYFLKIPQDTLSPILRGSTKNWVDWIEELTFRTVGQLLPEDKSWHEKIKDVPTYIEKLSLFFKAKNQVAVIIIDGLDEIKSSSNSISDFIGIFPKKIPDNIKFIISCIDESILPSYIIESIPEDKKVVVNKLGLAQCEEFVKNELEFQTSYDTIQSIANKSEGHPLYLNYLINYININYDEALDGFSQWINTIPPISGNINNYYNSIWNNISGDCKLLKIVCVLSQLRAGCKKDTLIQICAPNFGLEYLVSFDSIKHLLIERDDLFEIYHSSFQIYITSKLTKTIIQQINDDILEYCNNHKNSTLNIRDRIFHLALSTLNAKCIEECTQDWADRSAINNIAPSYVLSDIKMVLAISIEQNNLPDTIRLLLLGQRIEFRYDSVFAHNAFELTELMIAIGNPEAAINYLIREQTILVSTSDALYFLQVLFERGYNKEAQQLYDAIEAKYRLELSPAPTKRANVDPLTFVCQFNAITLLSHIDKQLSFEKFNGLSNAIKRFGQVCKESGDETSYELIEKIRSNATSWMYAYNLRMYDGYITFEELASHTGCIIDKDAVNALALSAYLYYDMENAYVNLHKNDTYYAAIKDIEHLIDKHNFEFTQDETYILLFVLSQNSNNTRLVSSLIEEYTYNIPIESFCGNAGVDIDLAKVHKFYNESIFKHYNNYDKEYPPFMSDYYRYEEWESYIICIIENLAAVNGVLCSSKADGLDLNSVLKRLKEIINRINFSFDERSRWKNSFAIPEQIFPFIYSKITLLFINFFDEADFHYFTDWVGNKSDDQLSLYTEGYRKSLFSIINEVTKSHKFGSSIKRILELLENHILNGVQCRWERTQDLLKITKIYALIGDESNTMRSFQNVLDTSMGPSWYKEDQMSLINDVLELTPAADIETICKYSVLLDATSGEMTFQRYVRNEKESFAGNLTKQGYLSAAIEYLKFEIMPDPKVVILNAETKSIDMPRKGDGYNLGANNLSLTNSVIHLLKDINDPLLEYALSEIFMINDDNFRYIDKFAKRHASLLSRIQSDTILHDIVKRISIQLTSTLLESRDRNQYINTFTEKSSEVINRMLQNELSIAGIKITINKNIPNSTNEQLPTDNYEEACKYYESNQQIIPSSELAAHMVTKMGDYGLWHNNYSDEQNKARGYLKSLIKSKDDIFKFLGDKILQSGDAKWIVAKSIFWYLENVNINSPKELHDEIIEHFSLMIRPDSDVNSKWDWIKSYNINKDPVLIILFIIWLLNHPDDEIRTKSQDSLVWIAKMIPSSSIPLLIEETCLDNSNISPVTASVILRTVAEQYPNIVSSILLTAPEIINKIKEIKDVVILNNYIFIGEILKSYGCNTLANELNIKMQNDVEFSGEVILDEPHLSIILGKIEILNKMKLLNHNFCMCLNQKIKEYCSPLSIDEFISSDKYLKRSFYTNSEYCGRYSELVNRALNYAIYHRVNKNNITQIVEIINS